MRITRSTALLAILLLAGLCVAQDKPEAEKKPARVVYMVDASGSMLTQWRAAFTEVAKSLDGIGDGQEFGVLIVTENDVNRSAMA